jgi:hypothetical protein
MTTDDNIAVLNKRLGVVIALLLKSIHRGSEGISLRDQVQLLSELGVRPKDIADILNRTQTYVNKELVSLRKNKGRAKKT